MDHVFLHGFRSLRFIIMLSIACSPVYSHITSLSYLLIHLCESYIIMFVHLCASQIYYFIYSYLCLEYPYFVFSLACWRVGELCGHAAHASPAHPGAVACVWAHITYCPIIKCYLMYCLACVARPCQSVPFGK